MRSTENHRSPSIRWSDGFRFRQTNTSTALLLPLTCLNNKWPRKQIHMSRIHNLIWRCKREMYSCSSCNHKSFCVPLSLDVLTMAADGHVLGFDQVKDPCTFGVFYVLAKPAIAADQSLSFMWPHNLHYDCTLQSAVGAHLTPYFDRIPLQSVGAWAWELSAERSEHVHYPVSFGFLVSFSKI